VLSRPPPPCPIQKTLPVSLSLYTFQDLLYSRSTIIQICNAPPYQRPHSHFHLTPHDTVSLHRRFSPHPLAYDAVASNAFFVPPIEPQVLLEQKLFSRRIFATIVRALTIHQPRRPHFESDSLLPPSLVPFVVSFSLGPLIFPALIPPLPSPLQIECLAPVRLYQATIFLGPLTGINSRPAVAVIQL